MPRKRIAVITARADSAEQKEILCGIAEAALAADTDVAVYSNIYNHWTDDKLLNYENVIYSMLEPRHFDGAVITAEAFRDIAVLDEVTEKLRRAELPTVVIGGELDGFYSVYSDDAADMEQITEHIISVHGFTDIDILTGPEDDINSRKRAEGCTRVFRKHGVEFNDSKLHYGNFWNDSGEALAYRYISGELPMPQAVICTNDHMAFGLCDALTASGVAVPDTLTVTGYDHTGGDSSGGSRIYHYPLLTTYRRSRRKMGRDAVNLLLGTQYALNEGDRLVCGNSCSCGACRSQLIEELNTERIGQYHTVMSSVAQLSGRLTLTRTLAEYTSVLGEFFYLLHGADKIYLCLDTAWNSNSYEGEEFLCCAIESGQASAAPIRYSRADIPVPFRDEQAAPSVFYVLPLCFQTRLFGTAVLSFGHPTSYDFSFRDWLKTAADTLEFLRMKNDIHYLAQCQRASSMYDALTGFYNLREFRQILDTAGNNGYMQAVKLGFAPDGEFIYGENFRSDIISAAATAIKQSCTGHEICCRASEDIFIVLCKDDGEALSDRLQVMLHNAMCGSCDERQVLISYAAQSGGSVEQLCTAVSEINEHDMAQRCERMALQHYNSLLDIRSGITKAPEKAPTLSQAAKRICVSEGYFRSVYRQCFGVSYNQDCISMRLYKARQLLLTTSMSIYAVAVSCGYTDEKYFARQFRQALGCSPMEYRRAYS